MRSRLMLLVDVGLVALATVLSLLLREDFVLRPDRLTGLLPYLVITVMAAVTIFVTLEVHRGIWRLSGMADYLKIVVGVLGIVLAAVSVGFIYDRLANVPRSLPAIQAAVAVILLVGARVTLRLRHSLRRSARTLAADMPIAGSFDAMRPTTVLVVGSGRSCEIYLQGIKAFARGEVEVAGVLGPAERHVGRRLQDKEILGLPEDIDRVLRELSVRGVTVDCIVVAAPAVDLADDVKNQLLGTAAEWGIAVEFFADRFLATSKRAPAGAHVSGMPPPARHDATHTDLHSIASTDSACVAWSGDEVRRLLSRPYWRMKRGLDVVGALIALVIGAPLMLLVALGTAVSIGLPVLFVQTRPGRFGVPVRIYKFRTMRLVGDQQVEGDLDAGRASRFGGFLRRTRLDELPQLFNILMGTMSFVGPRPLLPIDQPAGMTARLLVRPGLTGWAQVRGGRDISPDDKTALDVWYVLHASLWRDLDVVLRTVWMVVFGDRSDPKAIDRARRDLRLHAGGAI